MPLPNLRDKLDQKIFDAIYSRSLIGHGDFGVNRARIERWLAALDAS